MHLNDGNRVRTQARDLEIFELLRKLRFIDIDQVCRADLFTSRSRAKARLLALSRSGHIDHFFVGTIAGGRKAVYCLPATRKKRAVRPLSSAQTERFVDHQLAVNEVYLVLSSSADPGLRRWERCTAP